MRKGLNRILDTVAQRGYVTYGRERYTLTKSWTMPKTYKTTRTQLSYLAAMERQGTLHYGWGGMRSTQTVRLLEERGLATLRVWHSTGGRQVWEASATASGRALLQENRP